MAHALVRQLLNPATRGIRPSLGIGQNVLGCNGNWGNKHSVVMLQTAQISGKTMRPREYARPAPYPYKTKKLNYFRCMFDNATKRFDENTKVIIVEGNIAAGKTTLAKALAEELDMRHFPEVTMDAQYVNDYGYDLRTLDHLLPSKMKTCDVKTFYTNPKHFNIPHFQMAMYENRFSQYVDALAHLLNTGQGVILERSAYSDFVFFDAMVEHGYITKAVGEMYYGIKKKTIGELMKPHLVIYLDAPVPVIMERIKKRNIDYEVNSKVLTPQYLQTLEDLYKKKYLQEAGVHAELLIYDWSKYGEPEVVVEDIERIDFDKYDKYDKKMEDWRLADRFEWADRRYNFTSWKETLMCLMHYPLLDIPEITIPAEDVMQYEEVMYSLPGNRYARGYNADLGDTGIVFKTKEIR